MSRTCSTCGHSVSVGAGKWAGDVKKPETMTLVHKSASLCHQAGIARKSREKVVASARIAGTGIFSER